MRDLAEKVIAMLDRKEKQNHEMLLVLAESDDTEGMEFYRGAIREDNYIRDYIKGLMGGTV